MEEIFHQLEKHSHRAIQNGLYYMFDERIERESIVKTKFATGLLFVAFVTLLEMAKVPENLVQSDLFRSPVANHDTDSTWPRQ